MSGQARLTSYFVTFFAGMVLTILLEVWGGATPKARTDEWQRCGEDRSSYRSDSLFHHLRPECRWWDSTAATFKERP